MVNRTAQDLLSWIDLSGPSGVAVNVISFLANYGHITDDNEVLAQFLNTLKEEERRKRVEV
jgi:hypothetical protein